MAKTHGYDPAKDFGSCGTGETTETRIIRRLAQKGNKRVLTGFFAVATAITVAAFTVISKNRGPQPK